MTRSVGDPDDDAPVGRSERTRRVVVDATVARLRSEGAFTVEQVAADVGVSVATIYNRFPEGRDGLLAAAFDSALDRLVSAGAVLTVEHLLDHGLEQFVDRWMASPLFASQVRLGPDALADARAQRMDNDPEGLAGSLRGAGAGSQPSYWHDLAGIHAPTLLVVGDEDPKFRATAMRLAAGLPQSTISVVPEAGHAPHLENLESTSAVILGFLAELDEGRQAAGGWGPKR